MHEQNTLTEQEAAKWLADVERKVKVYAGNKSGILRKAEASVVKDYKFWQKAKAEEVEVVVSGFYLVWLGLFVFFMVIIAIGISWFMHTLFGLFFLLIGAFATYDLVRMHRLKVVINRQGMEVNGRFSAWNNILRCYTVQSYSRNVSQLYFLIFTTNGLMYEYDLSGLEHDRLSHIVFHYMQHYRATTSQPS